MAVQVMGFISASLPCWVFLNGNLLALFWSYFWAQQQNWAACSFNINMNPLTQWRHDTSLPSTGNSAPFWNFNEEMLTFKHKVLFAKTFETFTSEQIHLICSQTTVTLLFVLPFYTWLCAACISEIWFKKNKINISFLCVWFKSSVFSFCL